MGLRKPWILVAVDDLATRRHIRRMMEDIPWAAMFASTQDSIRDLLIHNPIHALVADPPMLGRLFQTGPCARLQRIVAVVNGTGPPARSLPSTTTALVRLSDPDAVRRLYKALDGQGSAKNKIDADGAFPGFYQMVGASPIMRDVFDRIRRIAAAEETVLIQGETGTGKELAARAIHAASCRRHRPFIVMPSGAGPSSLMESSLFGHRRGAFTGAIHDRRGYLKSAQQGILLLDDIDSMDLSMQAKLLRILQDKCFTPLGSDRVVTVDVRYLATSNQDLYQLMRQGKLRQDLYYRIKVLTVEMPPLRRRAGDICLLADYFVHRLAERGGGCRRSITAGGRKLLGDYHWPGNVRQLESLIQRLWTLTDRRVFDEAAIKPHLDPAPIEMSLTDWHRAKDQIRLQMIDQALAQTGGNRTRAAARLGIHRNTLRSYLRKNIQNNGEKRSKPDPDD